jgi:hypothetical protein
MTKKILIVFVLLLEFVASPPRSWADVPTGCTADSECKGGRTCEAEVCIAPRPAACSKDIDCAGELICDAAVCVVPRTPAAEVPSVSVKLPVAAPPTCAEERQRLGAIAETISDPHDRLVVLRSMPICPQGTVSDVAAARVERDRGKQTPSASWRRRTGLTWSVGGSVSLSYSTIGVASTTELALSHSSAIGGYIASGPDGSDAIVLIDHYNYYFDEAGSTLGFLAGGYKHVAGASSSSLQLGGGIAVLSSATGLESLVGAGFTVDALLTSTSQFGFAINADLAYFPGEMGIPDLYVARIGLGFSYGK